MTYKNFLSFGKHPLNILVLVVYLLVMFWQLEFGQTHAKDSTEYIQAGKNMLHTGTLYAGDLNEPIDYRLYSKRPPLYPIILISTFFNEFGLFTLQILAGMLALFIGKEVGQLLLGREFNGREHRLFIVLAILFPSQWIYGSVVMSDLFLQLFFTSSVYFLLLIRQKNTRRAWLGFALSMSAGMLLKPVMAPMVLLMPVLFLFKRFRRKPFNFLFLLIPFTVFMSFSFRNQKLSGQFEYSSISHINLLQYNTRYLLSTVHGEETGEELLTELMIIPGSKSEYDEWVTDVNELGIQSILEHPFIYARIHLSGMFRMLIDPGRFDLSLLSKNDSYREREGFLHALSANGLKGLWIAVQQSPYFLVLLLLATINLVKLGLFLLACYQYRKKVALWVALSLPFIILTLTGPIGASRFMLPMIPVYVAVISLVKIRR